MRDMCRRENWWEVKEFREKPFDVVFDCAEGRAAWQRVRTHKVLKGGRQGGRFIAVVPQECAHLFQLLVALALTGNVAVPLDVKCRHVYVTGLLS